MTEGRSIWVAVRTVVGGEVDAAADLRRRGYIVFVPWQVRDAMLFRRSIVRRVAYYPGYIFTVLDDAHSMFKLRRANGVVSVANVEGRPVPVPGCVMEKIMSACTADGYWSPGAPQVSRRTSPAVGSVLMISDGPLVGLPGVVERVDARGDVVLTVDVFGRATMVACSLASVTAGQSEPA